VRDLGLVLDLRGDRLERWVCFVVFGCRRSSRSGNRGVVVLGLVTLERWVVGVGEQKEKG
jgi:hypothetical protein